MIPLYDQSHSSNKTPVITITLIALNILVFLFSWDGLKEAVNTFGVVPQEILSGENLKTLFSSMFLHGGLIHLVVNMWFLWVFGDNLENSLGRFKFLVFYLATGLSTGFIYCFFAPDKTVPVIGASGAISGVLGAYLVLFPGNKIKTLVLLPFFVITTATLSALLFLGIWFAFQFLSSEPNVANQAHIIGFLIGVITGFLARSRGYGKKYSGIDLS